MSVGRRPDRGYHQQNTGMFIRPLNRLGTASEGTTSLADGARATPKQTNSARAATERDYGLVNIKNVICKMVDGLSIEEGIIFMQTVKGSCILMIMQG